MQSIIHDFRYGLRILARNPAFAVAAIICLSLGIGATTAIFSVVNAVLLRPLPYIQPERLVKVYSEFGNFPGGGLKRFWMSPPEYMDLKRDTKSWESLDAWVNGGANLTGQAQPVRATASFVTGGLLTSLGVHPLLGRTILPDDDDPKSQRVVDISYGIWQRVFGGDRDIVGKDVLLNGKQCTIIGVMPRGFAFPPGEVDPPEVWTALQLGPADAGQRGSHYLYLLGRLKPNVTAQQAQAEMESLVKYWGDTGAAKTHHFSPQNHTIVSYPFQAEVVSNVRPALLMLLGAVCFVLLIACVNVANLLLARAEARQREIAVRTAIGASSWRLLRQFIAEGILLSFLGAILGLGLAFAGLYSIKLTNAGSIPRASEIGIDATVLMVALLVSIFTGIVFGMAPMMHLAIKNVHGLLKEVAGGAGSGSAAAQNFRRGLVAFEIGSAMLLLICCGLMVRAFWKLQEVDIGVNPRGINTLLVTLPSAVYSDNQKVENLWSRLQERVTHLPGVQSAALVSGLPPSRRVNANDTDIEGFVPRPGGPIQNIDFYQIVSDGYFETMGIRLMEGRLFNASDAKGAPDVVIINQTMARMYWNNQSPLGRRIRPGGSDPWCTIVGVVADVKNAGIDKPTGTELYLPYRQPQGAGDHAMYVVVRGKSDSLDLAGAVRRELSDLDSSLPVSSVRSMDDVLSAAQSRPRFLALLLTVFSGVALALALVGIYGVLSYLVARRSKEFGLRMALGAPRSHVLGLVLKQGALLAGFGVVFGLAVALAFTRLMASLLFGVGATDPVTFLLMPLALAAVALVASYIPARRATKVDPMVALRYE
ncbi:MAG TPA: ABC transporter permease [Candidatus Angelobacter sp.]|nr:ABC transporter permease [Candidatus Angelobacter sp.]